MKIQETEANHTKVITAIYNPYNMRLKLLELLKTTPNKEIKNNKAFIFVIFVMRPTVKPPALPQFSLLVISSSNLETLSNEVRPRYIR